MRTEFLGGREYLIREATILIEGVLNGSDGPLFYSSDEISSLPGVWNGMPLVANHPMGIDPTDGKLKPISARQPKVLDKYKVGEVYEDRIVGNQRLVDVWFDVQNSIRIDYRIIPKVRSGEPVNVSTGIFSKKNKAVQNASYSGKGYTHTVHNIRPDHLAVLLDDKGACSVQDGCGINLKTNKDNYEEKCSHCGTALEIDPDSGICNRCGKKNEPKTTNNILSSLFDPTPEEYYKGIVSSLDLSSVSLRPN